MMVAGEAGSGEEACAICEERPPDVVLMDLRLPGLSGVQAIRKIRETNPDVRFIVLTTYDGDEDIRRALDAGAQAYLLKAMSHVDVTAAIRKVHSGARVIPQSVSKTLEECGPAIAAEQPRRSKSWSSSPTASATRKSAARWASPRPRSSGTST